jgi:hypothetical protein
MSRYDEFEARDIWLASFLDAMGVEFVRAVPVAPRRCRFLFRNDGDRAHDLSLEWREGPQGHALVVGPALVASYRKLTALSQDACLGEESDYGRYTA